LIAKETIQEIQNRIDIYDIVGSFVKLKRRGTNYIGNCPFHNEKTPSFPVRWLANRYNIDIIETETSPEYKEQQQTADSLHILNQFAAKYFASQLTTNEEGQNIALSYLKERGFTDAIIEKFQIGYCLNQRDGFTREALKNQYSEEILKKSGLSVERDGQLFDNYRGRIIFPIQNQSGKIIGFGARVIGSSDRGPKYINTPENELYVKSKILYGSYFARHPIDKFNECYLVEGYTDVTAMHQAGIENVVASGGTALTIDQLRLIKKYTTNLTIIYDGDKAGVKAALRGLDLAIEEGLNVQLVLIPDNEDPDSYVKKVGADEFRNFINQNKKDFILFQLEVALADAGNDSTRKAAVVNQIAESISKLSRAEDFTRQQDYIKRCSSILRVDEQGLTALVKKLTIEKLGKEEKKYQRTQEDQPSEQQEQEKEEQTLDLLFKDEMNEQAVVRSLIEFGHQPYEEASSVADYIFLEIEKNGLEDLFDNKLLVGIIKEYKQSISIGNRPDEKYFLYHSNPQIGQMAVSLLTEKHQISPNWTKFYQGNILNRDQLYREEVRSSMTYLKLKKVKRLIVENQFDLEKEQSEDDLIILLQTHKHLKELEMQLMKDIGTVIFK